MSNQLVITSGAKVRSLEGVITGSTGVLNSLPINGSNGIPQLDSNGKILVSQLPNSVMEYKGTWDAATNTPTLADGTGNQGDVYLCNVAGTVNFGAGPITFYVGDQVIYSGTIWQRASGASGTVTSVAVTETGDALSITGSPIVNSGTINIGFAGTSAQYVAGDGSLITFPTTATAAQNLITEVYNETGATLTKGTVVYINGGHGNLPTVTKAIATGDSTSAQTYGVVRADITNMNNGFVTVIGSLGDLDTQAYAAGTQLYLSSTTAGAWTSTKQYAPAHLVYVGIVVRSHPTQGVVEIRIQNGFELDELHNVSAQTPSNNQGLFYNSSNSLWENKSIATALGYTPANDSLVVHLAGSETITGTKFFDTPIALNNALNLKFDVSINAFGGYYSLYAIKGSGSANSVLAIYDGDTNKKSSLTFDNTNNYIYTFPSASGTIALTSDIPSLSGYVPYTGATALLNLGTYNLKANNIYAEGDGAFAGGGLLIKQYSSGASSISGYNTISSQTSAFFFSSSLGGSYKNFLLDPSGLTNATTRSYTLPDASGTLALTIDIPSLSATAPISYSGGVISISQATTSTNGYLSSTDWNTFNNKVSSQWVTSGSNIYYNSGYVGINYTTPMFPLHVNGSTFSTDYWMGRGTGDWQIIPSNSINALYFKELTGPNTRMTILGTGEIGIGTTTPSYLLDVNGTGRFTGALNGTSAVFSSSVTAQGGMNVKGYTNSSSGNYWEMGSDSSGYYINALNRSSGNYNLPAYIDAQKLIINSGSGGNVGIGTSSPSQKLTIGATNGYPIIDFYNSGTGFGDIGYNAGTSTFNLSSYSTTPLAIYTNGSERMRITSGGNVLIGTTSSINYGDLSVQGSSSAQISIGAKNVTGANASLYLECAGQFGAGFYADRASGSMRGWVSSSTSGVSLAAGGTSWGSYSDERMKDIIEPIENAIDKVNTLRTVIGKYKTDEVGKRRVFLIAQDVEKVLPEAIFDDKSEDKILSLQYTDIIPLLVAAIKEQQKQIEELKAKIK